MNSGGCRGKWLLKMLRMSDNLEISLKQDIYANFSKTQGTLQKGFLWDHSCRITVIWGNIRIFERGLSESPVLMV